MDTWLINTHHPLDIDLLILGAIQSGADDLAGGGIALNLGILSASGGIYRVARTWNLAEYQRASAALERLGLVSTGRGQRLHDISFEDVFEAASQAAARSRRRADLRAGRRA